MYVHSPLGLCGRGKISLVCTSVCRANRVKGLILYLRGERESRKDSVIGGFGLTDAAETDVVLYNGADDVCESCECVGPVFVCDCHKTPTSDEVYTAML